MRNYLKPYSKRSLPNIFDDFFSDSFFKQQSFNSIGSYNIIKIEDSKYKISLNVAGYNKEDIEITQNDDYITIKGSVKQENNKDEYLYQGFSSSFNNSFSISRGAKIINAIMQNGILDIIIEEENKQNTQGKRINIQ